MTADSDDRSDDGRHDFDFLTGTWRVHHRKLADMTDPACAEWVEFDSDCWLRQTLGGLGNVDNFRVEAEKSPTGKHWEGMSLRLFDPEQRVWRIWWAATNAPGRLDDPMVGRWDGKHGVFHGADVVGGEPVAVRFHWDDFGDGTAQWEQSFSFDGGREWVTNWRMSFTRVAEQE